MATVEPLVERLYSLDELLELRRNVLRYARTFPPGGERNQHLHVAVSIFPLFRGQIGCGLTRSEAQHCQLIDPVGTKSDPSD
jgi:hypothetical protein